MPTTRETVDLFVEFSKGFLESKSVCVCMYVHAYEDMNEEIGRKEKKGRKKERELVISFLVFEEFFRTNHFLHSLE